MVIVMFSYRCQNAKVAAKVKAKVEIEEENSADGDTSTGEESGDDGGTGADSKVDGDSNVGDDEDVWEELQREARKESILETKSKETHPVHCPYFPSVRCTLSLPSVVYCGDQASVSQCKESSVPLIGSQLVVENRWSEE